MTSTLPTSFSVYIYLPVKSGLSSYRILLPFKIQTVIPATIFCYPQTCLPISVSSLHSVDPHTFLFIWLGCIGVSPSVEFWISWEKASVEHIFGFPVPSMGLVPCENLILTADVVELSLWQVWESKLSAHSCISSHNSKIGPILLHFTDEEMFSKLWLNAFKVDSNMYWMKDKQ